MMRQTMISLPQLEAQYRALTVQMEQSEEAFVRRDLDAVEACAQNTEQALAELAQASTQLEGMVIAPEDEAAWEALVDAIQQAFARAEENRAQIQLWICQTHDVLSHVSRGGRAVNGYAASGAHDEAEFLSARG